MKICLFYDDDDDDDDDDWLLFAEDARFRIERSRSRLIRTVYA